jgi:DNA polymerase-3 subunit alpha
MQIAQTLAGFTAGEADILRRAMGKKKKAELDKQKERFINGALKNGIAKDVANFVFTKIEPFAQYGFNKSHAAAYALIAYQTAYLKTYHKEDFIAATMSTELTNTSKLREFVEELKRLDIEIIRPSINKSFSEFKAIDGKLFYGLGAIKSVGFQAILNIVKERERNGRYKTFVDFINRVDAKDVNKLQLEGLVKSGALDEFDTDRNKILNSIPKIIQQIKNINEDKSNNQKNLFDEKNSPKENFDYIKSNQWNKKELLSEEFKSLGFYISDHPLNEYKEIFNQLKIITYKEFLENDDSEALVAGTIMSIQEKKSAKGTPFAIVKFSDNIGEFELFLFSEILVSNRDKIKESESFVLTLHKDRSITEVSQRRINIRKILSIDDIINKPYTQVTIELRENYNLNEIKNLLTKEGKTKISLIINNKNKKIHYSLQNTRKFDFNQLKTMKSKEYVKKITV